MKRRGLILGLVIGIVLLLLIITILAVTLTQGSPKARVPVNGGFSQWDAWVPCPASCGESIQHRKRSCTNPAPKYGGKPCEGSITESQRCSTQPCPGDGKWSAWSNWGNCTGSCDSASQTRTRLCNNPPPEAGGADCAPPASESRTCEITEGCPVNGQWSEWNDWIPCSVTCGGGTQSRNRVCDNPPPENGGDDCIGSESDTQTCSTNSCPVDGNWSTWKNWNTCTVTCGGGTQKRIRDCDSPAPAHGGDDCLAPGSETQSCSSATCPIHGNWGHWGNWGACSVSCGGGTQGRARSCDNPAPDHGGNDCAAPGSESRACGADHCPVNGNWGAWGNWDTCTVGCGGGTQGRSRLCNSPEPAHGGSDCIEPSSDTQACGADPCPVHGNWGNWALWSACTVTCGGGSQSRSRLCDSPAPDHGGNDCPASDTGNQDCGAEPCPIHGNWGAWGNWGACSASCGGGTQGRTRACDNPAPDHGGDDCALSSSDSQNCGTDPCPIHGEWGNWGNWGTCSVSCDGGSQSRSRACDSPAPEHNGNDCDPPGSDSQDCGTDACPTHGNWAAWSAWSSCPVTCGSGQVTRARTCTNPAPSPDGDQCQGLSSDSKACDPMDECCFSGNTDHAGDDIDTVNSIASPEDCQKECRKHTTCVAFVYDSSSNTCQVKSAATPTTTSTNKVHGPRYCPGDEPNSVEFCFTHHNVDLPCTQSVSVHSSSPVFPDQYTDFGTSKVLENKCDAIENGVATYYIGPDGQKPLYLTLDFQCVDYIPLLYIKNSKNLWGVRATSDYTVSISDDANTWTQIHASTLPNGYHQGCEIEIFDVPVNQAARYVKLDMLEYYGGSGGGIQYFNARPPGCKPTTAIVSAPPEYTNANLVTSFAAGTCLSLDYVGAYDEAVQKDIVWSLSCDPTFVASVEIVNGNAGSRATKDIEIFISSDNIQWENVAAETLPDTRNQGASATAISIPINKCGKYLKLSMLNAYGTGMQLHKVKINTEFQMDSSNKDKCGPHLVFLALDSTFKDTALYNPTQSFQYPALPAGFTQYYSCGMHYRGGFLICDTKVGNCYHHKIGTGTWRLLTSKVPKLTNHGQMACATHPETEKMYMSGGYDDTCKAIIYDAYDAKTSMFIGDTWESRVDMHITRRCHGSIFLSENEVLIAGGVDMAASPNYDLKSVQVYHVNTNTYENKADLNEANSCLTLARLNLNNKDIILGVGGYDHAIGAADYVEIYDIAANQWTTIASLPRVQYMQGLYVYNNVAHLFGGIVAPHNEFYTLQTEPDFAWIRGADMTLDYYAGVTFTY